MSDTPLNEAQRREVKLIAKTEVREYFDYYLLNVAPVREKALREHTHLMVEKHDDSDKAHGAVERRLNKAVWVVAGAATAGSGGAVGLLKLLGGLGV